ncbi:MAG: hypothetical protein DMG13_19485 [Acidobacteria bacterium]|nr:MAG: hypothetical protein DMG13_19485 [Acidobacteriota bacterium]
MSTHYVEYAIASESRVDDPLVCQSTRRSTSETAHLLQSLELLDLGFLVLEPTMVITNYYDLVPAREWESLGVEGRIKPRALVIVVIGSGPESSTGNFQAPLLINQEKMTGKQVILTDSGFSVRQQLL